MNSEQFSVIGVAVETVGKGFKWLKKCQERGFFFFFSLRGISIVEILSGDAKCITTKNARRTEQ